MFRPIICVIVLAIAAACGTTVPGPDGPVQLSAAERYSMPDENSPVAYEIPDQVLAEGNRFYINVYGPDFVNGYNPCRMGYTHKTETLLEQVQPFSDGSETIRLIAQGTTCIRSDLLRN